MSEEEKTLEEQTETIIDTIETETEDDVREAFELNHEDEPVTPEELEEVKDLVREVRELRGGLRGAADPNMIQKHLDNFLAALCGETPVDSNVRNSTEYWLKRLADGEGGSTKPIYCHNVVLSKTGEANYITGQIFSASGEPINTAGKFKDWITSFDGGMAFFCYGYVDINEQVMACAELDYLANNTYQVVRLSGGVIYTNTITFDGVFTECSDVVYRVN